MKKHGLLKVLGALLLLVMIASFALPGRSDTKDYIGLVDVMINGMQSLYYFFYLIVYILCIGGFYGILSKSPAFKELRTPASPN